MPPPAPPALALPAAPESEGGLGILTNVALGSRSGQADTDLTVRPEPATGQQFTGLGCFFPFMLLRQTSQVARWKFQGISVSSSIQTKGLWIPINGDIAKEWEVLAQNHLEF